MEFYIESAPYIKRIISRMLGSTSEVENLFHDAYMSIKKSIGQFQGRSSFYTWIYAITENEVRMHRRRARTRPQPEYIQYCNFSNMGKPLGQGDMESMHILQERFVIFEEILTLLTPEKAEILKLKFRGEENRKINDFQMKRLKLKILMHF